LGFRGERDLVYESLLERAYAISGLIEMRNQQGFEEAVCPGYNWNPFLPAVSQMGCFLLDFHRPHAEHVYHPATKDHQFE
jgi:hypothetical protein